MLSPGRSALGIDTTLWSSSGTATVPTRTLQCFCACPSCGSLTAHGSCSARLNALFSQSSYSRCEETLSFPLPCSQTKQEAPMVKRKGMNAFAWFRGEQKYSAIGIKDSKSLEVLVQDQQLAAFFCEGWVPMYCRWVPCSWFCGAKQLLHVMCSLKSLREKALEEKSGRV